MHSSDGGRAPCPLHTSPHSPLQPVAYSSVSSLRVGLPAHKLDSSGTTLATGPFLGTAGRGVAGGGGVGVGGEEQVLAVNVEMPGARRPPEPPLPGLKPPPGEKEEMLQDEAWPLCGSDLSVPALHLAPRSQSSSTLAPLPHQGMGNGLGPCGNFCFCQ